MIESFKQCSCFSYMINSKKSTSIKSVQLPIDVKLSKFNQNDQPNPKQQQSQRKKLASIEHQLNCNQSQRINSKNLNINSKKRLEQMNDIGQSINRREPQIANISECKSSMFERGSLQNSYIEEDIDNQQLQESDLPTQKSQIIVNDINADVQQIQNNYLFSSQKKQNLWDVYTRVKTLQQHQNFSLYLIKNKINGQLATAKIFVSFSCYCESLQKVSKRLQIQKYTEQIYDNAKNQIKCLIKLTKNNCRHICKIIDYELKPPSYIGQNQIFDQGYAAIVYENVISNLEQLLEQKKLIKLQRKKLIYQLVCAVSDIHENAITICDLSIKNIQLDLFDNLKLIAPEITQRVNNKKVKQISLRNFQYCSPQVLRDVDELSHKMDLWSLGILITRILSGKILISESSPKHQLGKIKQLFASSSINDKISKSLLCTKLIGLSFNELDLVQSLLKYEPLQRMECRQLIGHKYFQNLMNDSIQYEVQQNFSSKN